METNKAMQTSDEKTYSINLTSEDVYFMSGLSEIYDIGERFGFWQVSILADMLRLYTKDYGVQSGCNPFDNTFDLCANIHTVFLTIAKNRNELNSICKKHLQLLTHSKTKGVPG